MIDARINAMINFVEKGNRVADIGADHGYLSIFLAKSNRADFIVATDKNAEPLAAAKKNIAAAGLDAVIETRLGDGLQVLTADEVDTICIGGMGGALICKILDAAPNVLNSVENLILQPMNAIDKLKCYLRDKNFFIADIDLAESGGIIYEIIFASRNAEKISVRQKIETSPLREKYLALQKEKLQRILDEMSKSSAAMSSSKYLELKTKLQALMQESATN